MLLLVGLLVVLVGCSGKESVYKSDGAEEIRISKNQIEHQINITTLSYLTEKYSIKEEKDGNYVADPSDGLFWECVVHKDDPMYEELMEELDYYVNTRGFDLAEKDSTFVASGEVDDDMMNASGINFEEDYGSIEFTDTGLILNDVEFTEVK